MLISLSRPPASARQHPRLSRLVRQALALPRHLRQSPAPAFTTAHVMDAACLCRPVAIPCKTLPTRRRITVLFQELQTRLTPSRAASMPARQAPSSRTVAVIPRPNWSLDAERGTLVPIQATHSDLPPAAWCTVRHQTSQGQPSLSNQLLAKSPGYQVSRASIMHRHPLHANRPAAL